MSVSTEFPDNFDQMEPDEQERWLEKWMTDACRQVAREQQKSKKEEHSKCARKD